MEKGLLFLPRPRSNPSLLWATNCMIQSGTTTTLRSVTLEVPGTSDNLQLNPHAAQVDQQLLPATRREVKERDTDMQHAAK